MDVQEALAANHLYASLWTVKNPSCHGPEAKRERQTYTDWMNKQLISAVEQPLIYNLEMSLADGTTLCKITDILACQKLVWPHPRPALLPHRLDNVRACLVHLLRFGVDLTGVLAEDIVHGDPKTALALSRAIYTRFQRHPHMTSPRVHHSSSPVQPQSVSNSPRLGDSQYLSSSLDSSSSFWANPSPVPMATADRAHTSKLSSNPIRLGDQHYFSPSVNSSASWATASTVPVATKDDMALFGWVERLLRVPVTRYEQFQDGIMLCSLVNQLCPRSFTQQQVLSSSPSQRMGIAVAIASRYLGAPNNVDIMLMTSSLGYEEIKRYLTGLRLAHEQSFVSQLHHQFRCSRNDPATEETKQEKSSAGPSAR